MRLLPLLLLPCLLAISCTGLFTNRDELLDAPAVVMLDGRAFTLRAFLTVDNMPPVTPPRTMYIGVGLMCSDTAFDFSGMGIEVLWALAAGGASWRTRPSSQAYEPSRDELFASAGGGPEWADGVEAQVVARIKVRDASFLLRDSTVVVGWAE